MGFAPSIVEDKWLLYSVKSKFNFLDSAAIEYSLKQFWKDVMKKLANDKIVYLIFRVKYEGLRSSNIKHFQFYKKLIMLKAALMNY